jgi:predicted MPP superfamily phosphohydrolase
LNSSPSTIDVVIAVVLFAHAVIGHFALVLRSHNYIYGTGLGRRTIDVLQVLHGLVCLSGPIVFWYVMVLDPGFLFPDKGEALHQLYLKCYLGCCLLTSFIVVPFVTIQRLVRRCPALHRQEATTVNVELLACRSLHGDGKHSHLARLPGNQVCQLDLSIKTLQLAIPPEWDGLTILHLGDLHFTGTPDREYFERVLDLCMSWQPDIVALTGDYVDSLAHHAWLSLFEKLQAREAKLAILGNHDHWYEPEKVRERLGQMGYHTPRNGWQTIEVRGKPMVVIGHEGPWLKPAPEMSGCPADVFRLCLSHTPDNIAWARANAVNLMLSGHVHGGQIRLPIIGSLVVPSMYGRRYDCGVFLEDKTVLHVTRGIGGKHPLRYNCRPEATLLVLGKQGYPRRDFSS